jgi:predicted nucleic acid-binding Zn ribbon protein
MARTLEEIRLDAEVRRYLMERRRTLRRISILVVAVFGLMAAWLWLTL